MTLLEAFRRLTPDCAPDDFAGQDAMAVVQDEVAALARRLTFEESIREDAAAEVTVHMVYGGSRTTGALECDSDKRVRGFLRRALSNKAIEIWRARRALAEDTIDDVDHPIELVALALNAEDLLAEPDLMREALGIEQRFMDTIVPACAERFRQERARQDFLTVVAQMRALAFRVTTIDDVVRESTGRTGEAAEAAVHQRHHRARVRLVDFIADEAAAGRLSAEQAEQFRGCVSFLHRRASSAKEAARAAQRDQR